MPRFRADHKAESGSAIRRTMRRTMPTKAKSRPIDVFVWVF